MEFIAQILLVALLLGIAFWRKALLIWLFAGICTGMMAGIWFADDPAYGIPYGLVSVFCLLPIIDQIWRRNIVLY